MSMKETRDKLELSSAIRAHVTLNQNYFHTNILLNLKVYLPFIIKSIKDKTDSYFSNNDKYFEY